MKFQAFITITNEKGEVEYHKEANSLVVAMMDLLNVQMSQTARTIKNTDGANGSSTVNAYNFQINAGIGTIAYGIIVGTGTNAVTLTDNALQTAIAHGTGSGKLSYGAVSVSAPATSGTTRYFTIARPFTNSSGAAITVNEIALYCTGSQNLCIDRTLNSFTMNDQATKTVTYTLSISI